MEYIRIPKELLSSPLWMYELSNDTKIFFIHLLNKATHKSCRKTFMREIFELDAGQVVMTQRDMAKTLNTSDNEIRKHISTLTEEGLISTGITQSVRNRASQSCMKRRTVITICNLKYYIGKMNGEIYTSLRNEDGNFTALNRKEEVKEFKNKKKQIIETPLKLVQKEEEQMVMLDPEAIGFKQGICHSPWIRSLVKLTKEPQDSIEQMAMDYAEMKFHEGNLSLSIKSFRYNCKNFITNLLTKKEKNDGKERTKQQKPQQPTIPQHRIADVDITRVPGHRTSIIGRNDEK